MNLLEHIGSLPVTQALGWTLLHFIWQGAVLAAALAAVLSFMRSRSANARYLVCCAGMLLMALAPLATLIIVSISNAGPVVLPPELLSLDLGAMPIWHRLTPLLPWCTLIWLLGVFIFQGRLILQWSRAQHLRHFGARQAPALWEQLVVDMSQSLGVKKAVGVLQSSIAPGPMTMGWLRPVILMPVGVVTGLTPQQLRTVIAHELAHVRRHDYIVNLFQSIIESLLFYHPAVWWLSGRLRAEREYCCDDVAVSVCGDPICYAKALSNLDAMRSDEYQLALATTGGPLMNRIFRVVGKRSPKRYRVGGWLAPIVIAAAMTAAASAMIMSPGDKADKKAPPPAKSVEKPDVAMIAKKMGLKRADVLAKLRDAGLDDEALLIVLREVEPNTKAVEKIEQWVHKSAPKKVKFADYEKKLIEKMKAEGKSKEEIKKALALFHKERELKLAQNERPAKERELKLAKYEKDLIETMKAEGKSKKEIKMALKELHAKFAKMDHNPSEKELMLAKYEKDLIETMKAEGKSKDEIKKAIKKLHAKFAEKEMMAKKKNQAKLAQYEKDLIKKMQAKGMSKEEIKKALAEHRKEVQTKKTYASSEAADMEKKLIAKMKKAGMSKEEIKRVIHEMRDRELEPAA